MSKLKFGVGFASAVTVMRSSAVRTITFAVAVSGLPLVARGQVVSTDVAERDTTQTLAAAPSGPVSTPRATEETPVTAEEPRPFFAPWNEESSDRTDGHVSSAPLLSIAASGSVAHFLSPTAGFTAGIKGALSATPNQVFARTLADTTLSNVFVEAIGPSLFRQHAHYVASRDGSVLHRLGHAFVGSLVMTNAGGVTLNYSEIVGRGAAAGLSNLYYAPETRTLGGSLARWGSALLWDALSNELKEFWPAHAVLR